MAKTTLTISALFVLGLASAAHAQTGYGNNDLGSQMDQINRDARQQNQWLIENGQRQQMLDQQRNQNQLNNLPRNGGGNCSYASGTC